MSDDAEDVFIGGGEEEDSEEDIPSGEAAALHAAHAAAVCLGNSPFACSTACLSQALPAFGAASCAHQHWRQSRLAALLGMQPSPAPACCGSSLPDVTRALLRLLPPCCGSSLCADDDMDDAGYVEGDGYDDGEGEQSLLMRGSSGGGVVVEQWWLCGGCVVVV